METNHIADLAKYELPELKRKGFFRRWHYMPKQMAVTKKDIISSNMNIKT